MDTKLTTQCKVCGVTFKYFRSRGNVKYCSQKCSNKCPERLAKIKIIKKGRKLSIETRKKMSLKRKGVRHSPEHVEKRRLSFLKNYGASRTLIQREKSRLRNGRDGRIWRVSVLNRDEHKCTKCGEKDNLEVHHITPFIILYEEYKMYGNYLSMYDIENGQTLCLECHKKTDSYTHKNEIIEYKLFNILKKYHRVMNIPESFSVFYANALDTIGQGYLDKLE
jgi:ferredoxin